MFTILLLLALLTAPTLCATEYAGIVVDEQGNGIGYATVYPTADPVCGTATASNGYFHFSTNLPSDAEVIISFIGYKKHVLPLQALTTLPADSTQLVIIRLEEQPVNLEEVVIAAKPQQQKNKRKRMQSLLESVYAQMQVDFPSHNTAYQIVSDVRMDSEGEAWGMEQMIARVVVLPAQGHYHKDPRTGKKAVVRSDSIQFSGEHCKRYFDLSIRALADSILAGSDIDKIHPDLRKAANAIDSGVVVHKTLWSMGNIVYDFANAMHDINHWTVSNESIGETVLTYTEKKNIIGIFVYSITRHYILRSDDLSVLRFAEQAQVELNIPFGYKVKPNEIQVLNLLNMGEQQIEQYRIRKVHSTFRLNTIYCRQDEHLYPIEKNLIADATIIGKRKQTKASGRGYDESKDTIPLNIQATQRATTITTHNVTPMAPKQIRRRVKREIVPINAY